MHERKRLSDILLNSDRDHLAKVWADTQAADEFGPVPPGEYVAHIVDGAGCEAKSGTVGYKLTFRICEGEYAGRRFWDDCWLTPAAMPRAKRDLGKLGITDFAQLDRPLPQGIRVRAKLTIRKGDDGAEYNRVRSFEVIGVDANPFAPTPAAADNATAPAAVADLFPPDAGAAGPYSEGR